MEKRILQAFIILIIILFGVSFISDANQKVDAKNEIVDFEENVNENEEITNGIIEDVNVVEEDSSNIISTVNAKVASFIVGGLNRLFKLGIKLIEGLTS